MAWGGFLDGFLKKLMVDTGAVGQISMDDLFVACSACYSVCITVAKPGGMGWWF